MNRVPGAVSFGCLCGENRLETVFVYDSPPVGEVHFDLRGAPYRREYRRCRVCGHFVSVHAINLGPLYKGDYVDATYGSSEGMRRTFERIVALPQECSDNAGRVKRIVEFAGRPLEPSPSMLDVGSGLGVFPWTMTRVGWACTALDPDPRAADHIRRAVGCPVVTGDFLTIEPALLGPESFHAVTFNKVLEHVVDPIAMLARARALIRPGGFVYVELPDVAAMDDPAGKEREEFFIEHHHVFSAASLVLLVERAGFVVSAMERLREPSGKYTLCAFAALPGGRKGKR